MTSYQCYGRADYFCPIEESKDLLVSLNELFALVYVVLKELMVKSEERIRH